MSNSFRVMKNTISLYIRTIILTVVSLFTVRANLNALGVADYGLYNVVAGFVSMFGFLSGTLTVASQRFFAIGIGRKDWNEINKYFSINLFLYLVFCVIVIFFAETAGLWFVLKKMVISPDRLLAAVTVYQFSIVNFIFGLIVSHFLALLVADENLGIYSMVSIVEAVLKVIVAYLLYIITGDKLIVYGLLLLAASILINGFYIVYSLYRYKNLHINFVKDKPAYKEVFAFLNWNMIGAIATVFKGQGINIVVNLFFGTAINAARGIAFQINNIVSSFSVNFMKAIDPQITKNYAIGDNEKFFNITCIASKLSFFLLFVVAIPFIANMEYVLGLWLKEVPGYTVAFAKLALIDALILSLTDPISTAVQAIGKVKWYQIIVSLWTLLNVPLSYLFLRLLKNELIPFYVAIVLSSCISFSRIIMFDCIAKYKALRYFLYVVLPCFVISIITIIEIHFLLYKTAIDSFFVFLFLFFITAFVVLIQGFLIIFTSKEKKIIISFFINKYITGENGVKKVTENNK